MRISDWSSDVCSSDRADDLGLRRLGLQQEGGKVLVREGMADGAEDLAALFLDDLGNVALQRVAEGLIGGEDEPGVAALPHDGLAGAVGENGRASCRERVCQYGEI